METQAEPSSDIRNESRKKIIELFNQGKYKLALLLVEKELKIKDIHIDDRTWLERQLPILYTTIAWQYVQDNNCEEAIPLF